MFNPIINEIFCDLDGVLADFDAYKTKHLSVDAQVDDDQMWKEIACVPNFYAILKPLPYAKKLWTAIKFCDSKRSILTAIPRKTTMPNAEQDKRDWVRATHRTDVFGELVQVNIGPYSRDKWKHAKSGDILIDDRADNIEEWNSAGGIGIYHDGDVNKTIAALYAAAGLIL